jgi:hypothetical protein
LAADLAQVCRLFGDALSTLKALEFRPNALFGHGNVFVPENGIDEPGPELFTGEAAWVVGLATGEGW